jgi:hypothetical protein
MKEDEEKYLGRSFAFMLMFSKSESEVGATAR